MRCDLFCTVIDNFGDIGVCWRLARQLAAEHGWAVRLWVDDLVSFARLRPDVDPRAMVQYVAGVEVRAWRGPLPADIVPADVVIEAFACELPEAFQQAMAACTPRPVWLNLEYLSAEDWVEGCHGQVSIHPRLGLRKTFYFPGFTPKTGGLLRERDLLARRAAFDAGGLAARQAWQRSLKLPAWPADAIAVSLFAYENPILPALLAQWRDSASPVACWVPEGRISAAVAAFAGRSRLAPGETAQTGALTLHGLPFVPQDQYDALLWACDVNFVRGEDSFVRAQWAARPMVWHIYPQHDDAHRHKLDAFLQRYTASLAHAAPDAAAALADFWQAWNGSGAPPDWRRFVRHLDALRVHAQTWCAQLAGLPDLCGNLVEYCENQLK